MKRLWFVCEGLADEPMDDLGGRTPLEAAKKPVMDELAFRGKISTISFVPAGLEPASDIACMAMLGYDPMESYTGLAPLEAAAYGIALDDRQVIFRADLVSLLDDVLMDPTASSIAEREAGILMEGLSKLPHGNFKFARGRGYKNFLIASEEGMLDELDELDCAPPSRCVGQKASKFVLKGAAGVLVNRVVHESGAWLEAHDINRVRIDLGENPANRLWVWGQGKKPKLIPFSKKYGLSGAYYAQADFVKGLGLSAGLVPLKGAAAPAKEDFVFHYFGGLSESRLDLDLKTKVKRIEEFDVFVGTVLKNYEGQPVRVCVSGDVSESTAAKSATRQPAPLLVSGEGIPAQKHAAFNEKLCAQVQPGGEKGHEFLAGFLKP